VNASKKTGRMSNEERKYIIEHYQYQTPEQISINLNRSVLPVYAYLDKSVNGWRDQSPEYSDVDTELTALRLSKDKGVSFEDAMGLLTTPSVPGSTRNVRDLKAITESFRAQCDAVYDLINSIESNTNEWRELTIKAAEEELEPIRKELRIQRARIQSEVLHSHNMPSPPPPLMTAGDIIDSNITVSCIYFAWLDESIVYVGKANNIRKRMKSHESAGGKVELGMPVSWIEFPNDQLYTTECFYIWSLKPALNNEVQKDELHAK
jgi:hypothetical protein